MNPLTPKQRIDEAQEIIKFIETYRDSDPQMVINILLIDKVIELTEAVEEYINNLHKNI